MRLLRKILMLALVLLLGAVLIAWWDSRTHWALAIVATRWFQVELKYEEATLQLVAGTRRGELGFGAYRHSMEDPIGRFTTENQLGAARLDWGALRLYAWHDSTFTGYGVSVRFWFIVLLLTGAIVGWLIVAHRRWVRERTDCE